mmetsp:Transcript_14330/g.49821  ORF Transcript_14330/g.49821 Transcript_14330/m.49821 type:complete len:432 (-) Transcript_14330:748-2043(-)
MLTAFSHTSFVLCSCSWYRRSSPPASSTRSRQGMFVTMPAFSTASRASMATSMIFVSATISSSHSGGIAPAFTRRSMCVSLPVMVMFDTAHAASFRTFHSPWPSRSMTCSMRCGTVVSASTCSMTPAATLDTAQHASLRMFFLDDCMSGTNECSAPHSITACVCSSLPVTMLPTARSAGFTTAVLSWLMSITSRGTARKSMTCWMRSSSPSLRYDSAQHVSVSTSASVELSRCTSTGSISCAASMDGCGLPRQKLLRVHVALRSIDSELGCAMLSTRLLIASSWSSTMSRKRCPSPAMLPRHQQHCSRTSGFVERSRRIRSGVMPRSTMTSVCSVDAMFVSAHAASNCSAGFSSRPRKSASTGTTSLRSTGTTGGSVSLDSKRRICFVPSYCAMGLSLMAAAANTGRWSSSTSLGTVVSGAAPVDPVRPPA